MNALTCPECSWQFDEDGEPSPSFCPECDSDDLKLMPPAEAFKAGFEAARDYKVDQAIDERKLRRHGLE